MIERPSGSTAMHIILLRQEFCKPGASWTESSVIQITVISAGCCRCWGCRCISQAPKDPLRHGLHAALANKLVRQTELDGLKWHLLKQILRVSVVMRSHVSCVWSLRVGRRSFRDCVCEFAARDELCGGGGVIQVRSFCLLDDC